MWKRKAVMPWLGILAVSVVAAASSGCASKARAKPPAPVAKSAVKTVAHKSAPALPVADKGGDDYVSGQRYYTGDGVTQDYQRAEELFRRAAGRGHAYAQYSLGLMYDHGYGVKRDLGEARRWYQKAADGGDSRATTRLATLDAAVPAGPVAAGLGPEAGEPLSHSASLPAGTELIKPAAPAATPPVATVAAAQPAVAAVPRGRRTVPAAPSSGAATPRAPAAIVAVPAIPSPQAPTPVTPAAAMPAPATSAAPMLTPSIVMPPAPGAARPLLSALPVKLATSEMSPTTARAISDYQAAMNAANYGMALRALELAREAGEITALGLSETQSAEELARMAILANDGSLAQVYLRQAAALGSLPAQDALNRLAVTPDLRVLSSFVSRNTTPADVPADVVPAAAPAPTEEEAPADKGGFLDRLFGGAH